MATTRLYIAQGLKVPANGGTTLSVIDVSNYEQIRIYAANWVSSAGAVTLVPTFLENNGLFGPLDSVTLNQSDQFTQVYPVPGNQLSLRAYSDAGGSIFVLVYGWSSS